MTRVVVLGDLNLDVHAQAAGGVGRGEERRGHVWAAAGGSGGTFARTAAQHGAAVWFIGCVGRDLIGDLLVRSLKDAGVVGLVQRTDRPSGVVLAWGQGDERAMVCSRGANDGILAEALDAAVFEQAAHGHVSGYSFLSPAQRPALERFLLLAKEHGMSVSVDPPPANLIRAHSARRFVEVLPEGAWLFPNLAEGRTLTGVSAPCDIVKRLADRFPVGALTLGPDGAVAWADRERHQEPAERVDTADTTGAGDVFAGAFVASYLVEHGLQGAARIGCAAAAAHLRRSARLPP